MIKNKNDLFFGLKSAGLLRNCTLCLMTFSAIGKKTSKSISNVERSDSFRSDFSVVSNATDNSDDDDISRLTSDEIRSLQLSDQCGQFRDVTRTIKAQPCISNHNRSLRRGTGDVVNYDQICAANSVLLRTSATEVPPALASCSGLGSKPLRLYRSMSFDKLHVFDLGVLRIITDYAHFFPSTVKCARLRQQQRSELQIRGSMICPDQPEFAKQLSSTTVLTTGWQVSPIRSAVIHARFFDVRRV